MKTKVLLKLVASGFVLVLATRAQALSYTATSFTFSDPLGSNTEAYGINDNGVVAGWYSVHQSYPNGHGFTYNAGSFTVIDAPDSSGAYGGTFVRGLNNGGSVIGDYHSVSSGKDIGFISNGSSYTTIDATSLNSNRSTMTSPAAANDNGQVVGNFTDYATGDKQAFFYNAGSLSLIAAPGATVTTVNGINNAGLIVGSISDSFNHSHGYIFNGSAFTIFDAPDAANTSFQGISNNGQILGSSMDANVIHYFVMNNSVYDSVAIPNLSVSDIRLYGINNSGQIVGTAYGSPSGDFGFVLTPVPLPAAAWLFGSVLLGLARVGRRSKALIASGCALIT